MLDNPKTGVVQKFHWSSTVSILCSLLDRRSRPNAASVNFQLKEQYRQESSVVFFQGRIFLANYSIVYGDRLTNLLVNLKKFLENVGDDENRDIRKVEVDIATFLKKR